jgi:hypothetical protein
MKASSGDDSRKDPKPKRKPAKVTTLPKQLNCRHSQLRCAGCGKAVAVSAEAIITVLE